MAIETRTLMRETITVRTNGFIRDRAPLTSLLCRFNASETRHRSCPCTSHDHHGPRGVASPPALRSGARARRLLPHAPVDPHGDFPGCGGQSVGRAYGHRVRESV